MTVLLFLIAGLISLIAGAELLVRGASRLASAFGISSLIIGLTVVAFGTSAPELAVSVLSALRGQADIALGNVVGSNLFNALFILGISAVIVPLAVSPQLIRVDVPLMIGTVILLLVFARDGRIDRLEAVVLFSGLLSYLILCVLISRRSSHPVRAAGPGAADHPQPSTGDPETLITPDPFDRLSGAQSLFQVFLILAGLGLLVLGSHWLVEGAIILATQLGASELVISLTIIAAGTSLPEVATSVVAALRGERDIAVGNVVGSNIFNILGVLGLSGIFAPQGIQVAAQAMQYDIPLLAAVTLLCLPLFSTGQMITRWKGGMLLGGYGLYTVSLFLLADVPERLPQFSTAVQVAAIPVLGLTLSTPILRTLASRRQRANPEETPAETRSARSL